MTVYENLSQSIYIIEFENERKKKRNTEIYYQLAQRWEFIADLFLRFNCEYWKERIASVDLYFHRVP